MKKNIIILSIFILVIIAIIFFILNKKDDSIEQIQKTGSSTTTEITTKETPENPNPVGIPVTEDSLEIEPEIPFIKPEGEKFDVKTESGPVSVSNVYKKSIADGGFNGVVFKMNNQYHIAFHPSPAGFSIVIIGTDIENARLAAEKDFIQTLNISKTDACKLAVSLAVPYNINRHAAGTNYGLSFCPNGKAFPK